eukprot:m.197160 g.197160  ORF g.197160 m.197160 type:complete len:69 (+) comp15708_c0_seq8:2430-2636(+)
MMAKLSMGKKKKLRVLLVVFMCKYGSCCCLLGEQFTGHVEMLAPAVADLARLEDTAQTLHLNLTAMFR